jgi:hypothetical protein
VIWATSRREFAHADDVDAAADRRSGTLFVLEEDPPSDRARWYCHVDGEDAPGFDSADEAVEWGLRHARGVVVRTVSALFYLAGEAPDDWAPGTDYRPWPPSAEGRAQIDADYEAACVAGAEEEARWRDYEAVRDAWLVERGLPSIAQPLHACSISLADADDVVWFEEFDPAGAHCGASTCGGRQAFGTTRAVLAGITNRRGDNPWVEAAVAAIERERAWDDGRRSSLEVYEATGEMFHVSAAANRASISRYGLDWRRMTRPGVAGARKPELDGVFLCESEFDVQFFTDMCRVPSDVWSADVSGRWVESGPSGWVIVTEPIPPSAVRLVRRDIVSTRR